MKNKQQIKNFLEKIKNPINKGNLEKKHLIIIIVVFIFSFAGFVSMYARLIYERTYNKNVSLVPSMTLPELRKNKLEIEIKKLIKGHPMEAMASYIADNDEKTAAYLVGIAKKESNWGKRKPVLEGQDCFNYWGYRGKSETMGSGGHTCFNSPQEAVDTVANRLKNIIVNNQVKSAKNLIVWKCGYSCADHSPESVSKWIKDVDYYSKKILN